MIRTSSSRIIVITFLVIALVAIAVNANWGMEYGFGLFASKGAESGPNDTASEYVSSSTVPAEPGAKAQPGNQDQVQGVYRGVSTAERFDISPPLSSLVSSMSSFPAKKEPDRDEFEDRPTGLEGPFGPQDIDQVVQSTFGDSPAAMPTPSVTFNSTVGCACAPPDPVGDVGPNHYVAMANLQFQIFNKTGTSVFGPVNINTLWSGFGGACQDENDGDPVVIYDQLDDRWILTQFTAAGPTYFNCVAISTSPDPTGTYFRYAFSTGTNFPDYPKYGMWSDALYISTREFLGTAGAFQGVGAYAINRAQLVAGNPAAQVISFLAAPGATAYNVGDGLLPTDLDGSTLPPAGAPNYYIGSMDNGGPYGAPSDNLTLWKYHADFVTPANSGFTLANTIPIAAYDTIFPCTPTAQDCIPQPGTAVKIDHGGYRQRPLHRAAYRNFGDHEAIVTNQSVEATAGISGIRWWEIRSPNSAPSIFQQGTYAPGDNIHRWMGSIAMDHNGNMALGYSASAATVTFPSSRYTGRLVADTLGTMPQGEAAVVNGTGSQTGTNRWGENSSMNIDPTDDCTFWYVNEWVPTTSSFGWQLRIGAFKFPTCSLATPTATSTATNTATNTATSTPTPVPGALVINEIDYDQAGAGTDTAEFIELKNVGGAAINLDPFSVDLIDGTLFTPIYQSINLPNVDLAAGGYYVICANNSTVLNCDLDVTPDTNLIQNGAPDAIGLRFNGTLFDAVSYEGNTGAPYTEGSGTGLIDDGNTAFVGISRFPDGADTNVNNVDLSPRCITPGRANASPNTSCAAPSNTPTNTATNTPTNTATNTPTNTATNTATSTATDTPTPANTATETATPTPTCPMTRQFDIAGGAGSGKFGRSVTALPNGNIVITDPFYDLSGPTVLDVGAVYLYNGTTGALISTLTGSTADDQIGGGGVTALTNGNYVVNSPSWGGTVANVGAVTWCSGASGCSGVVSSANSLVGSTASDEVGRGGVTALTNGNYVVASDGWDGTASGGGAVTWCNGATGRSGAVSSANSLVGSTANDVVGYGGVTALTNGNYVVSSSGWDGGAMDVGAVTWGNGASGTTGVVSSANSLVGSTANDQVGGNGVTALTNGNYIVSSAGWDGSAANVGAVSWCSGTRGITGVVSSANSLVGSTANDQVGASVTALTNGNYVIGSQFWDGTAGDVGAVTWGNGTSGITGVVSSANSLVGSTADDQVGRGVTALTNGNYVVSSYLWNGTAVDVGAVTWGNGTSGTTGVVSSANSLVGSTASDQVGYIGVTALTNGNYVVGSYLWNGTAADVGAVTWCNGTSGTTGVVSSANSLVGSTAGDQVGYSGITALTNGNYVVSSRSWDSPAADVGAVTWCNGTSGTTGVVSSANSLVGSTASDQVGLGFGSGGVTALTNGNYVVRSIFWDNPADPIVNAGAISYGEGTGGTVGPITAANSVLGTAGNNGLYMSFAFNYANQTLVVGRPGSNIVTIFLPCGGTPTPTATNTPADTPTATNTATFTPTPTSTNTPTATPSGTPTPADTPSISGVITYGNSIGNPLPPRFVKNVSVASTVGTPAVGPVITGTPGTYTLFGFGAGSYTIKPTKPGGANGAITSNDAARVAQGVSGAVPFVSQNQRFVSDASGNGTVSSNDAALIARFAAGLMGTGNVGQWKFFVTGAPSPLPTAPATYNDSRTYASVTSSLTGEDYVALLIGEASGNYNPATHPRQGTVVGGQMSDVREDGGGKLITVAAQPVVTAAEKEIVIPVSVDGVAGKDIISYEFNLSYDPAVIQPLENPVNVAGTVSRGLMVVANPYEPGLLRVVVYGPLPIDENGVLFSLRFTAVGAPGTASPLTFERVMFNEGESRANATGGMIELY